MILPSLISLRAGSTVAVDERVDAEWRPRLLPVSIPCTFSKFWLDRPLLPFLRRRSIRGMRRVL